MHQRWADDIDIPLFQVRVGFCSRALAITSITFRTPRTYGCLRCDMRSVAWGRLCACRSGACIVLAEGVDDLPPKQIYQSDVRDMTQLCIAIWNPE